MNKYGIHSIAYIYNKKITMIKLLIDFKKLHKYKIKNKI